MTGISQIAIYVLSVLVCLALLTWLVADVLKLWFPKHFENIRKLLPRRKPKQHAEGHQANARQVQDAALHVAKYTMKGGKSPAEAVEAGIEYLRSRTKEWKNEDEMRRWLTSQLMIETKSSATLLSRMKTHISNKGRAIVLAGGMVTGVILGVLAGQYRSRSDDFSIQIMNTATALKINKRTGETWILKRGNQLWQPLTNAPDAIPWQDF